MGSQSFDPASKRIFDIAASAAGFLLLALPMLTIALAVKVTSSGPILFRQARIGRLGQPFLVYKFRTMTVGADRQGSITTALDRRITPVGRFLRRWKLDELPQLWNVLIGNMSFVGPRPDVPGYADKLQGDDRRMLVLRPGITGPASLHYRNEEELLVSVPDPRAYNDSIIWPHKVRLNLEYMERWSFWKDICYILVTVLPSLNRVFKLI